MNEKMAEVYVYIRDLVIFQNRIQKVRFWYTSNRMDIVLAVNRNFYNRVIEKIKEKFDCIKDMYYIKHDGSCNDEIKIIFK